MALRSEIYDLVVIGGGPIGLATAYHTAKAGKRVLLLEQFTLYNQSGSSNDLVRMFRSMYTEDFMADLAKDAIDVWKDLEVEGNAQLILWTGLLNFGDPTYEDGPEGNLLDPIKNLKRLGMKFVELKQEEIEKEMPFKSLPSFYKGIWAPDNGCINVPLVLSTLATLCLKYGVKLLQHAKVKRLNARPGSVEVTVHLGTDEEPSDTTVSIFNAEKCAIAVGAYSNDILGPSFGIQLNLQIWEMVYAYYACDPFLTFQKTENIPFQGNPFKSMWFQFSNSDKSSDPRTSNLFYGFPPVPWGPQYMARIAVDNAERQIRNPNERRTLPSEYDLSRTQRFIREHLVGVNDQPTFSGTCLQTNLPDNMYVLDYIPNHQNVAIFTGGWGFKMVPLIGLILKQMLFDPEGTHYDISHFKITRRGVITDQTK